MCGPLVVAYAELLIPIVSDADAGLLCCLAARDAHSHVARGVAEVAAGRPFCPTTLRVVVDTATSEALWMAAAADCGTVLVEWAAGGAGVRPGDRRLGAEFWVTRAVLPGGDVAVHAPSTTVGGLVRGDRDGPPRTGRRRGAAPAPSLAALVARQSGVLGASTAADAGWAAGATAGPAPPIVSTVTHGGWGTPADERRLATVAVAATCGLTAWRCAAQRGPARALLPAPPVAPRGGDGSGGGRRGSGSGGDGSGGGGSGGSGDRGGGGGDGGSRGSRKRRRYKDLTALADVAAGARILHNREAAVRTNGRKKAARRGGCGEAGV